MSTSQLVRASESMMVMGWRDLGLIGQPLTFLDHIVRSGWWNAPIPRRGFIVDVLDTDASVEDRSHNLWAAWKVLVQMLGPDNPPKEVEVHLVDYRAYSGLSAAQQVARCPFVGKVAWQMNRAQDDANWQWPAVDVGKTLTGPTMERTDPRLLVAQSEPGSRWWSGRWPNVTWTTQKPTLHRVLPLATDADQTLVVKATCQKKHGVLVTDYGWLCPLRTDGDPTKWPHFVPEDTEGIYDDHGY